MKAVQEESSSIMALNRESKPVLHRFKAAPLDVLNVLCSSTYFNYSPLISPLFQILSGKAHDMKLFGYSLAGNMDLDENSYPDVAVGSLSDAALIYR